PGGLLEYSVVYTDRALNHMSPAFQSVMRDIAALLKEAYRAQSAIIVPGSGTFGMEAIARQFAGGKKCLVIRNGWFSYRWSQIFDMGNIPAETIVLKARPVASGAQAAFAPPPIDDVAAAIRAQKPALVFAPHVETASGIILPDAYIKAVAEAVRAVDGLFVLDCVASGAMWADMSDLGIDVLLSAPQKSWSAPACGAFVMLSARARERIEATTSSSFAADLRKWLQIMETYEKGGHAYHATPPTDALAAAARVMRETRDWGFAQARAAQAELGARVRALLVGRGFKSVAAEGFQAPGVVVSYTDDADIQSGKKFIAQGLQTAAGVPLMCDEPADFRTFRIGLFGLDKLQNIARTVQRLEDALKRISEA
ncbi:MAG: aminotransferase class V-fold PLP-dependent enzyme, partial [Proteobacteria bacterium]|nr:aminotransferase class V-fold PLP-dependent enzyme [Pseudomonadota bacterium]